MEAIVEREREEQEEEMVGVGLRTRRSSHRNHQTAASAPTATFSDTSFDMVIDGIKAEIESRSVNEEEEAAAFEDEAEDEEEVKYFEEPKSHGDILAGDEKGADEFSVMPVRTVVYPHTERSVGNDEVGLMEKAVGIPKSSDTAAIANEFMDIWEDNPSKCSNFPLPEASNQEQNTVNQALINGETQHTETNVIKGGGQEVAVAEYDVEKVLEKQETHDLFCPNCNSCITKRVILRRRKRKIQDVSIIVEIVDTEVIDDAPPAPYSEDRELELDDSSENRPLTIDEMEDRGPDLFRCLSCFSIFVPTGKFWIFGDKKVDGVQKSPQRPTTEAEKVSEAGSYAGVDQWQNMANDDAGGIAEPHMSDELQPDQVGEASSEQVGQLDQQSNYPGIAEDVLPEPQKPEQFTMLILPAEKPESLPVKATDEAASHGISTGQEEGLTIPIPSSEAFAVPNKSQPEMDQKVDAEEQDETAGKDTVIQMPEGHIQPVVSATTPDSDVVSAETGALQQAVMATLTAAPEDAEAGGVPLLDILKAIVYGGLLESITSLSVVTSAIGADASTLNVLALGVANLIGGLFVLAHNLRVLKHETSVERYESQLGRIGHFPIHATFAVLSYIVFGLMPPIIYAFSFRESDNRDLKLVTLASSSLLCIILLALGKAYARSPPKSYIKTLAYYVSLGIMVSGASLIIGDLVKLLMDKLGWFKSSYSLIMLVAKDGSSIKTA